jgi:hypothetical protein
MLPASCRRCIFALASVGAIHGPFALAPALLGLCEFLFRDPQSLGAIRRSSGAG